MPYFSINNKGELFGHGVVSARIVSKFITLTDEEFMAITYHMGFSGEEARTNPSIISGVFNQNIMALLLNIADMKATFWEEREVRNV